MDFGGFLPLELRSGEPYYQTSDQMTVLPVNSGRTAIWAALQQFPSDLVFLPRYNCPTVFKLLVSLGYRVRFYDVDDRLCPILTPDVAGDAVVVLVNYFGLTYDRLKPFFNDFPNIIIDNSQAFFCAPYLADGVFNIYSCRKFFGVPDGGYVIGRRFHTIPELEREYSYDRMLFLVKSAELGTHAAYPASLENELYIGSSFLGMSVLTEKILAASDVETIQLKRRRHFELLAVELSDIQQADWQLSEAVPYCFPLLLDTDIRSELIQTHIYVATLWQHLIDDPKADAVSYRMSKFCHFLPIDQRYDEADMLKLISMVRSIYARRKAVRGNV